MNEAHRRNKRDNRKRRLIKKVDSLQTRLKIMEGANFNTDADRQRALALGRRELEEAKRFLENLS